MEADPNMVPNINFSMDLVKPWIVEFSAASVKAIPKEGALKALAKIGISACFTAEAQEASEMRREQLKKLNQAPVVYEPGEEIATAEVPNEAVNETLPAFYDVDDDNDTSEDLDSEDNDSSPHVREVDDPVAGDEFIGRQVAVKFDKKMDPGIVVACRIENGVELYSVEFDDEENPFYDDIKFDELIFQD